MTTLPQTTHVRLPRPSSGGIQLSAAGGLAAGGGGGAAQAAQQGSSDLWRVIRGHIWLILIITMIVAPAAGIGANIYLEKYYPRYTATGWIQVQTPMSGAQLRSGELGTTDTANTALEIRTAAKGLTTDALMTRVLSDQNGEIRRTQWFRQFNLDIRKAKADFEDHLSVTPLQDTKLVKVEFTYAVPDDCKTIVFNLVQTYLEDQKKFMGELLSDRTQILTGYKIKTEIRLRDLLGEMREKQMKVNTDGGGIGRIGIKEIELSKLVGEQIEAQMMKDRAEGMYNSVAQAVQQGQDPPGLDKYVQQIYPYSVSDLAQIIQMENEEALALDSGGTESSRYKQIHKRVELMRASYQKQLDAARAKARVMVMEEYGSMAGGEKVRLEGLTRKVDNLKSDLGELSAAMLSFYTLQDEQRGLLQQVKDVKQQIDNVMAMQGTNQAVKAQWFATPEKPLNRSFPRLQVVLPAAVVLGLLLSLGIAFLHEALDQSIRSPRDIAKVGQINLLGIIPDESQDPQSAGARLPVVIFDAPHSAMAESFRHVRTKLQHTASLDTTRSIMVTSPSPGDGKTTIACNLAAGLALNGRRILLVDANFRRPEIHKVFGLSNDQGFSDVLNAVAAFDEVLQETQVPNLAVMSAGPKPMNPTELFESQLLVDFIDRALEEFDHVIFDSGPIMVVAEAQAMAPRVDGVISVVRAKTNNRGLLQRMRDELRKNKAEHLGVVLNAVRAQGGGYYARNIQTYYDYANNA